jgi:hypothetical protein
LYFFEFNYGKRKFGWQASCPDEKPWGKSIIGKKNYRQEYRGGLMMTFGGGPVVRW